MPFQNLNFNFKGQVPMASIMQAYQNKASQEEQMRQAKEQEKRQKLNQTLQIIQSAAGLVSQGVQLSTQRQQAEAKKAFIAEYAKYQTDPAEKGNAQAAYINAFGGQDVGKQLFNTPKPVNLQHMFGRVGESNKSEALAFNPQTNQYLDQSGKPVQKPITAPPSSMNQTVELTEVDRSNKALNRAAEAYLKGNALPSKLFSSRTANGQKAVLLALEKDPNFNMQDYQVKLDMKKDYTTKGVSGKNLTSLNTAINHLDRLYKSGAALDNKQLRIWNKVKNTVRRHTGDPAIDKMLAARDAVTNELGRVFQGVGEVTESERAQFRERMSEASSPAQIKAVADEWIQLLAGRIDPLKQAWNTKLKGQTPAVPFTTPAVRKVLKQHGYNPDTLTSIKENEESDPLGLGL